MGSAGPAPCAHRPESPTGQGPWPVGWPVGQQIDDGSEEVMELIIPREIIS